MRSIYGIPIIEASGLGLIIFGIVLFIMGAFSTTLICVSNDKHLLCLGLMAVCNVDYKEQVRCTPKMSAFDTNLHFGAFDQYTSYRREYGKFLWVPVSTISFRTKNNLQLEFHIFGLILVLGLIAAIVSSIYSIHRGFKQKAVPISWGALQLVYLVYLGSLMITIRSQYLNGYGHQYARVCYGSAFILLWTSWVTTTIGSIIFCYPVFGYKI